MQGELVIMRHIKRRIPDFKEFFHEVHLKTVFVVIYLTKGQRIYTLSFYAEKCGENMYTLTGIAFQDEEDDEHNSICLNTADRALYNYRTDCLAKDVYLFDKFQNDADWFSTKLLRFFKNVPQSRARAFARGIEIVNRVTQWKWCLVRRFCDNLLERWYAPDANGVAPFAMWTWHKFQEDFSKNNVIK